MEHDEEQSTTATESKEESTTADIPENGVDPAELTKQLEALKKEESEITKEEVKKEPEKVKEPEKFKEAEKTVPAEAKPDVEKPFEEKEIGVKPAESLETISKDEIKGEEFEKPSLEKVVSSTKVRSRFSKRQYEKAKLDKFINELFSGVTYPQFIKNFISNNNLVIFAKSECPWCEKAHLILEKNKVEHAIVYIDLLKNHTEGMQKALEEMTGLETVPNVFISQKHIGGYNDLHNAFQTGLFNDYLRNTFDPYEYDLIVIGGGSGGIAAALEAAKFKKKIALCDYVEPTVFGTAWGLGGTCTNVGCVPKKIMHHASLMGEVFTEVALSNPEKVENIKHEWGTLIDEVQNYVKSLNWNYRKKLKLADIDYFNARAKFVTPHSIKLETNDPEKTGELSSKCFIIAVGCRPNYLDIKGAKKYCITSDDFFSLKEFPGKTLIIGGSYVALECAGILNHLGACVSVMIRSISLRGFDSDMVKRLEQHIEICGVKLVKKCIPIKVTKNATVGYHVSGKFTETDEVFEDDFDTVMMASGRKPNTSHLGLYKIKVKVDPKSLKIITKRNEQTSVPHIFAIGDAALNRPQLTPVAIKAGKFLANRLFGSSNALVCYKYIPTTIFTPLEYGCVGEGEDRARELFGNKVVVWEATFETVETVFAQRKRGDCFLKLVCVRIAGPNRTKRDKVIGFHVLCYKAGELTQGFALAIRKGLYKHNFDSFPHLDLYSSVFTKLVLKKKE